jgi:DNA-binding NarL/FixJ family response regulator
MLGGIITEILAAQPDIEVVATVADVADAFVAAERTQATVAVLGVSGYRGTELSAFATAELLYRTPSVTVVTVTSDGRDAVLHLLKPCEEPIDDVSPQRLLSALRKSSMISAGRTSGEYVVSTWASLEHPGS